MEKSYDIVCHHPAKFDGHRHCGSGSMFIICFVNSQDHVTKGLCDFMDGSLPCHHHVKFRGHRDCDSGDVT